MNKTYLFIDGTNLYSAQFELFGPNKFLIFSKFIKDIELRLKIHFNRIYFYASYSPQPKKPSIKAKSYLKNEALFYRSVKSTNKLTFFTGYRSKTSGKEKEVDVKLAVDIVDLAHQSKYNNLFLLTGDADFMEALHVAKRQKIPITVLCMETRSCINQLFFTKRLSSCLKRKRSNY